MEAFKLLFMCIGFATTVDISVKVQFRGSAMMTSYRHEETITAKNEHELREKLTKTLENALLDKQIDEVIITTKIYHGNKVHSTQVTKFDATTPNGLDDTTLVTTTIGNDITKAVTSSASRNTTKFRDVTTATVLENVFTTRSITSIASTQSLQKSTLTANTDNCGVRYKLKCFRAVFHETRDVNLGVAKSVCENKLANIYDVTHMNMLEGYLRSMIPDGGQVIAVRTGMSYKGGELYSTIGQIVSVPTEFWLFDYPYPDASRTTVVVSVDQNLNHKPAIFIVPASDLYLGALCENES
ncbi:uncharacterized protein LOC144427311 [Styela clava]